MLEDGNARGPIPPGTDASRPLVSVPHLPPLAWLVVGLAALAAVDWVVIFDDPTPRRLIAALLPDVLVKGGDWGENEIVGREEVEAAGGEVVRIPVEPGYSTTEIIQRIRKQNT